MFFFMLYALIVAATVLSWKQYRKDFNSFWENAHMTGILATVFGGFALLVALAVIRSESDMKVNRHPELVAISKVLPAIREASPVEYAKLVQEIDGLNRSIDSAKGSTCSNWTDWFYNDKHENLPKIEIR